MKKLSIAVALLAALMMLASPALATDPAPDQKVATPPVPTAAPVEMNGLVPIGDNALRIKEGHVVILSSNKELLVKTGLFDSAGQPVMKTTGLYLLLNESGQLFKKSGQVDGAGNPLFIPDGRVLLNWRLVINPSTSGLNPVNANFAAQALKAFALPGGNKFVLTPTGDSQIDNLVMAATNKYFNDIQSALNGNLQNVDPAVARAMSQMVNQVAPAAIKLIRVVGILAGLTDTQTAALIRLQKDPVVENYVAYNDKAKAEGLVIGRNTYNQHLAKEGAKQDFEIVGSMYVEIGKNGRIRIDANQVPVDYRFSPKLKKDAAGHWFLEVRSLNGDTLYGKLYGSFTNDGELFSGTAFMSKMLNVRGPTVTVQQAPTFSFPDLRAPQTLNKAAGVSDFFSSRPR